MSGIWLDSPTLLLSWPSAKCAVYGDEGLVEEAARRLGLFLI
jgi:acetyl-CoA carboxylase carboxyltransferase component